MPQDKQVIKLLKYTTVLIQKEDRAEKEEGRRGWGEQQRLK
jgi:hypothetical protein